MCIILKSLTQNIVKQKQAETYRAYITWIFQIY